MTASFCGSTGGKTHIKNRLPANGAAMKKTSVRIRKMFYAAASFIEYPERLEHIIFYLLLGSFCYIHMHHGVAPDLMPPFLQLCHLIPIQKLHRRKWGHEIGSHTKM